jgi:HD-GYP domain-containing protein (c-di-GMP phosphodiesterase class II)
MPAALAPLAGLCAWLVVALGQRARANRRERDRRHALQHDAREASMLALAVRLLTLRDPAAGPHAAAVAHHARQLARAAGLSEREQQIAHTTGLLHDIGAHTFSDALLAHDRPLDAVDRLAIREHPSAGARLLRTVAGFEAVAAAVEAHHERVDGTGYPHGLARDEIPMTARIVAIAEVYDTLTAPDGCRPCGQAAEWAAHELRRVAGTQLDARLVERFLRATPPAMPRPGLERELRVSDASSLPQLL